MGALFLVCKKEQKEDKSKFVTKICRNDSYYYFHVKISPKLLVKPLLHRFFSLTTLITKL